MDPGAIIAVAAGAAIALVFVALHLLWQRAQERKRRAAARAFEPRSSADFARMFTEGEVFRDNNGEMTIELARLAELHLPSGRIVACDPLVFPDTPPFGRSVPPGDYRVEASIARIAADHVRVAAMRVVFELSSTPVRWEPAVLEGEDLEPGDLPGYGVDAGVGCFMDAQTARMLITAVEAQAEPDEQNEYYTTVLARDLERAQQPWTDHHPDPARPHNVVIVRSGWGDGVYASYWGLDDAGEPVALLTDFAVV